MKFEELKKQFKELELQMLQLKETDKTMTDLVKKVFSEHPDTKPVLEELSVEMTNDLFELSTYYLQKVLEYVRNFHAELLFGKYNHEKHPDLNEIFHLSTIFPMAGPPSYHLSLDKEKMDAYIKKRQEVLDSYERLLNVRITYDKKMDQDSDTATGLTVMMEFLDSENKTSYIF
jgi:hypothetical protein